MNDTNAENDRAEMLAKHVRAEMESANMAHWSSEEGAEFPSESDTNITNGTADAQKHEESGSAKPEIVLQPRKRKRDVSIVPVPPRSCYILFMNSNRDDWFKENPKGKFNDFQKFVSAKWKALGPEDRNIWKMREFQDRERYLAEVKRVPSTMASLDMIRSSFGSGHFPSHSGKNWTAGEPRTAFVIFMQEARDAYMSSSAAGLSLEDFQAQMADNWTMLPDALRAIYERQEKIELEAYEEYKRRMHVASPTHEDPQVQVHITCCSHMIIQYQMPHPAMMNGMITRDENTQMEINGYITTVMNNVNHQMYLLQQNMTRYLESSVQSLGAAQGKQLELLQQEVLRQREEIAYLKDQLEGEKKRRM